MDLKAHIRTVPDFPKPGIDFYDITTLLLNGPALRETVDRLAGGFGNFQNILRGTAAEIARARAEATLLGATAASMERIARTIRPGA